MSLSIQILFALILAVIAGLGAGTEGLPFCNAWIAPIGKIFVNLIKMMIVPVVFTSLIVGMTSLGDTKKLGRIGLKTVLFYLCTTAVAIVIGFAVAGITEPGVGLAIAGKAPAVKAAPSFMEVLVGMIPTNPLESMVKAQILPIIVFAIFIGYGILQVEPERQKIVVGFFDACAEVCYKVVAVVMSFAPVGVFCLLVPVVAKNGPAVLLPLISVIVTMAIACVIHTTVVYSGLVSMLAKMSPMKFFHGASEHMLVAFTTCSSAAALPINMKNTQEKLGVSREVSSFVLPLGATINMDGTAIYMGICSLFIANVFGIHLTMNQMMMIVLTGTLASIGTAGVPGAGLIMLAMVLQSVGLPLEGLALVAGIDRVLDMMRTCVNVTGDTAAACIIDNGEQE